MLAAAACPPLALALGAEPEGGMGAVGGGVVDALPGLIESRLATSMRTADDATLLFYRLRDFRPAWTRAEQLDGLLEAVASAGDHGLDSADFALEALRAQALEARAGLPVERVAERELLFTDMLARLAQQLRHGKVDPRRLYRDWNFSMPATAVEQAGRLAQLLDDGQTVGPGLAAAVQAQAPDVDLYRQLQLALKQYRVAAEAGDWPKVAAGPTLRPGERGARVAEVR
ncbi:ErfK/YbiS/YcfS/YnhG family protein, partial [Thauera linaloolentis 47Lol = DSM 12138]